MQPDSNNKEKNSIGTCRRSSRTANSELIEPEMPVQRVQTYESPDGRGSNDTTLRMRESTYRREGGVKSKTDGLSSNPITLVRNVAGRDQLQAKLQELGQTHITIKPFPSGAAWVVAGRRRTASRSC